MTPHTPPVANAPTEPGRPLTAVLWDFDGTLADTEPLWIAAEYELVESLGRRWTLAQAHQLVGKALLDSAAMLLAEIDRTDLEPAWVVQHLLGRVVAKVASEPVPWRPGALELLAALKADGIPCALVSASYRVLLDAVLARLPEGSFTASVAGDEVEHGKPHPESYLRACELLGVEPAACVVLEDSVPGAEAGNASGAAVVAIEHVVPVPDAPRRHRIASLAEVDVAALAGLQRTGRLETVHAD
ncbi:MAG: HAD family hydrolase [Propionibacteriaceae bacterium]